MQRILLQRAAQELGYVDTRQFKRWCVNNDVGILMDSGSRKLYVIEEEFEEAKSRRAIEYLERKGIKAYKQNKYRPQGEHERKYFSILTRIISE
jgi:hypothetical protein